MTLGPAPAGGRGRARTVAGFAIGVLLLAAALAAVGLQWGELKGQWAGRRLPDWGAGWALMLAVVLLPVGNWVCTSAAFWSLTRRHGRVGAWEMGAVLATAGLLNYLPLRPGLVGRIAYHRVVNGIGVGKSVRVLVGVLACTVLAAMVLLAAAAVAGSSAGSSVAAVAAVAPALVMAGVWGMAWARRWPWADYAGAAFFRYLDMLAWTGRYAAAFALWGTPIGLGAAAVFAAVSQIVSLVPLAGNGLGLREWGTGYTTRWLISAGVVTGAGAGGALELGLAADLVNRLGELISLVPMGIVGWVWVARRVGQHRGEPVRPETLS